MIFSFTFYGRPFSINRWTYATRKTKTKDARAWETEFLRQLAPQEMRLKEMADKWRKSGGQFTIKIECFYLNFYNDEGEISSKTIDITNFEKIIQDMLFSTMGLNDKLVTALSSSKEHSITDFIRVQLELNPKSA